MKHFEVLFVKINEAQTFLDSNLSYYCKNDKYRENNCLSCISHQFIMIFLNNSEDIGKL